MNEYVQGSFDWLLEQCEAYEQRYGKVLMSYTQALGLSVDQAVVLRQLCTEDYDAAFLTGPAGTGKSYTVKLVKELMNLRGYQVYRTAATGVAAQLIRGTTIHRFLGLGSFDVVPLGYWEDPNCCEAGCPRRSVADAYRRSGMTYDVDRPILLIIDEISMLTSEQLVLIYEVAKYAQGQMEQTEAHPLRFLLVGDLRQLGAVAGKDLFPSHHHYCFEEAEFTIRQRPERKLFYGSFFGTGPFEKGSTQPEWRYVSYGLYHQHRQGDKYPAFREALYYLGRGENLNHPRVAFLKERVFLRSRLGGWRNCLGERVEPDRDLIEATHLFMRNGNKVKGEKNPWHWHNTVGEHNEKVTELLKKRNPRCRTYYAEVTPGLWSVEEILDYFKPIPSVITLYEGMRFLCRYNYCDGIANGTMTRIVALYPKSIEVEVIETGERYTLTMTELPLPEMPDVYLGSFKTCAFGHVGNAMTYWACQGMTLKRKPNAKLGEDCVVLHLEKRFKPTQGLFYMACSRVESPEQLYILADSYEQVNQSIYCDPRVLELMDEAENRTRCLTGEPRDQVICTIQDLWETRAGYACRFTTTDPNYPELTLFYNQNHELIACSRTPEGLNPVQVPANVLAYCEALLQE